MRERKINHDGNTKPDQRPECEYSTMRVQSGIYSKDNRRDTSSHVLAQKRLVGLRVAALTQISQRKKAKERERGGRGKGKGGRERELNHYGNMKPDQVYQKIQIERSGFMNPVFQQS